MPLLGTRPECPPLRLPALRGPAIPLPADGLVSAAQLDVERTVLRDHHSSVARERAKELYLLARRALRGIDSQLDTAPPLVSEVLDECGGTLPALCPKQEASDAHNVAVGTAIASVATDLQHPACEEIFTWLNGPAGRLSAKPREHPTSSLVNWVSAGPRVTARILTASDGQLSSNARLRYRTATSTPARPTLTEADVSHRASKLPSMLWASWMLRLLPTKTAHQARIPGIRRACATLMLLPGTPAGQRHAAHLLGNSHVRSGLAALRSFVEDDHIARGLAHLAHVLDQHAVPIDYARRRTLFTIDTRELPLDEDAFRQLCRRHGSRTHQTVHLERARWHLGRLLLGADPGSSNHAPTWSHRSAYRMPPGTNAFLLDQAAGILNGHGIDEPVVFEPPAHWLDSLDLPIPPLDIPTEQLRSLLQQGPTQAKAAKTLNVTIHQLRLLTECHALSVPELPRPPRPTGEYLYPRQAPLAPDQLRDLYQGQGLQQKQIAEMVGCTPGVVHDALTEAGIPLRPRRAAGELERSVSRAWLQAEYLDKGRRATAIARELHVETTSILDKWNIPPLPRRPRPLSLASFPALSPASRSRSRLLCSASAPAGTPFRRSAGPCWWRDTPHSARRPSPWACPGPHSPGTSGCWRIPPASLCSITASVRSPRPSAAKSSSMRPDSCYSHARRGDAQRSLLGQLTRAAVSEGDRHNDTAPDATGLFDTTIIWALPGRPERDRAQKRNAPPPCLIGSVRRSGSPHGRRSALSRVAWATSPGARSGRSRRGSGPPARG